MSSRTPGCTKQSASRWYEAWKRRRTSATQSDFVVATSADPDEAAFMVSSGLAILCSVILISLDLTKLPLIAYHHSYAHSEQGGHVISKPARRARTSLLALTVVGVLAAPPGHLQSASASTTYTEQQGHHGANTFTNYHNASGIGPRVDPAAWVQVSCKVYEPYIASVNPDGYWYRLAGPPWNDRYYAAANTFMNGD